MSAQSLDYDVGIVGAGVMGATVALNLVRAGLSTVIFDRGPICREASGVNAGTLTMNMTRAALIPHALRGWELWTTAERWLGEDPGVTATPGLSLAFTAEEEALLTDRARARAAAGAPITLISGEEAQRIEPNLTQGVRAAAHCPIDGHVTAYLTGRAYRKALVSAGATIRENTPIGCVQPEMPGFAILDPDGARLARTKRIVLAGGVWLEEMLGWLGLSISIKCLINQLLITERTTPCMRTVLSIANGLLSLKQFANGTVLIGGGWQGIGDRERGGVELIPENFLGNLRLAAWCIPALRNTRVVRAWLGLEAETADALPLAGPVPGVEHAYVLGSVHSGYTSGPCFGQLLAALILGREPDLPLFPPDRLLSAADPTLGSTHNAIGA